MEKVTDPERLLMILYVTANDIPSLANFFLSIWKIPANLEVALETMLRSWDGTSSAVARVMLHVVDGRWRKPTMLPKVVPCEGVGRRKGHNQSKKKKWLNLVPTIDHCDDSRDYRVTG
eukprot:scaffold1019_cov123-Cylindrotheca_fusiformis.AAC.3